MHQINHHQTKKNNWKSSYR